MSRPVGSANSPKVPEQLLLSEQDRLELIARLLLEIVEAELLSAGQA
jgi:hypothetical protein